MIDVLQLYFAVVINPTTVKHDSVFSASQEHRSPLCKRFLELFSDSLC